MLNYETLHTTLEPYLRLDVSCVIMEYLYPTSVVLNYGELALEPGTQQPIFVGDGEYLWCRSSCV